MTEDETWQELERKQLSKKQKENEMKNKDLLFSHWYDSLEGTKSQGFAYKAWCAGWDALQKESILQEISDIGQEAHTDHPMRHWDRTCPACLVEQEPESWMGVSDNPYCNDADCNDPDSRAMRWHNKLLDLRKQAALDGLAETSREIEQTTNDLLRQSEREGWRYAKECEAEIKRFKELSEYRLQLLMKMPEKKKWVSLTDKDIDDVTGEVGFGYIDVAHAIEAKLKERNNG